MLCNFFKKKVKKLKSFVTPTFDVGKKYKIAVPSSKSITNRVIHIASLAEGRSFIDNILWCDDTKFMLENWIKLGVKIQVYKNQIEVFGCGGKVSSAKESLEVGNSGTTARFVLAALGLGQGAYRLEGVPRMAKRPLKGLFNALKDESIHFQSEINSNKLVVKIQSYGFLRGGLWNVCSLKSSQFLSSLLMIAPYCQEKVKIQVQENCVSKPYINLTLDIMKHFDVEIKTISPFSIYTIDSPNKYKANNYTIETDASSASYFFAIAAILSAEITIDGFSSNSLQGDLYFLDILEMMGVKVTRSNNGSVTITGSNFLKAVHVNMVDCTDVVPSLIALSLFAEGTTVISGSNHMKHKECDRVSVLKKELSKLGAKINQVEDNIFITGPQKLSSAVCETHEDHRIAMSLAIVGSRVPGLEIKNPECVQKTYPQFWNHFSSLSH
ncbi:MAG: 3-phosphoshikimate 1-carboxyvinyltransferase [Zetaproteobacteria bacterium]|nr:3-phosphoshikimate 1-carboxyvinyltransferase [Pseudobdellovibrionaceae bacterium]